MIGSGKSSIVCAISLGLGGKPGFLGRAKDVKEFKKFYKFIDFWLCYAWGRRCFYWNWIVFYFKNILVYRFINENERIIICRQFKKESSHSNWKLNEKHVIEKKVEIK